MIKYEWMNLMITDETHTLISSSLLETLFHPQLQTIDGV